MVAKLDRLSRSLLDFASLMEDARREGWALVILDLGVDTTTPSGEMIANVMATFAQFERRLIGQRTKDALAVKKREGVKLGRPVAVDEAVAKRIAPGASSGIVPAEDRRRPKRGQAQNSSRWGQVVRLDRQRCTGSDWLTNTATPTLSAGKPYRVSRRWKSPLAQGVIADVLKSEPTLADVITQCFLEVARQSPTPPIEGL